jgi:hypothetical protein
MSEHLGSSTDEVFRWTGLGDDTNWLRKPVHTGLHMRNPGVRAGKHNDPAGRHLLTDLLNQGKPIAPGHADVTQKKVGTEAPRTPEAVVSRIAGFCGKAAPLKNHGQGIGYQLIIVNDQDLLQWGVHRCRSRYHFLLECISRARLEDDIINNPGWAHKKRME